MRWRGARRAGAIGGLRGGLALSLCAWLCLASACRDEPVIEIHFQPQDLGAAATAAPPVASPPVAPAGRDAGSLDAAPRVAAPGDDGPCATDKDCVAMKADCCECTAGGAARAVLRSHRAELERSMKGRCEGMMCAMMVSHDPSCAQKPACRARRCVLTDAR